MKKLLLSLSLIASFSTINAQWTSQGTGFADDSRGLSEIRIVDANTVWAFAYDGSGLGANVQEFTMTSNGGSTWTSGDIDMGDLLLEINNLSPANATTAWVSALIPSAGKGVVFKTDDGGVSWNQQLVDGFQAAASFLNGVHFFDANVGIAYGDPIGSGLGEFEVWRTIDGGDTWTQTPGTSLPNPLSGEYGYNNAPIASGDSLWFTTSKGRLYRTTDRGVTWFAYQTPIADFGGVDTVGTTGNAHFNGPGATSNGYLLRAVGTTTPVYTYWTSTNGGQTWQGGAGNIGLPFTGTRFIINYIPGTTTIVATSATTPTGFGTSVSANNGTSWDNVESVAQRGAAAFLNMTTGWTAGFSDGDPNGSQGIYKLTGTLGTGNVSATAKFKIYPNPASSTVTISAAEVGSYNLSVTDLSGKVVMTKSLNGIENTLDISALSTGAYFFELNADNKKEVVKILKN